MVWKHDRYRVTAYQLSRNERPKVLIRLIQEAETVKAFGGQVERRN